MTLLVTGCSFSSGWGFSDFNSTWAQILAQKLGLKLKNIAQTAASNQDIFLSALKSQTAPGDIKLVQWTALNRITVSPSPINPKVVLSHNNPYLTQALPGISAEETKNFVRLLTLLNQDWKHFFDLVDMVEILQQHSDTYFINGMLHWDQDFWSLDWALPLQTKNQFLEFLLQTNEFDDMMLDKLLTKIKTACAQVDQTRWINLTNSWQSCKLDSVSEHDSHPGPLSQVYYADQIYNFLKEKNA
jgi:hypothetical protein